MASETDESAAEADTDEHGRTYGRGTDTEDEIERHTVVWQPFGSDRGDDTYLHVEGTGNSRIQAVAGFLAILGVVAVSAVLLTVSAAIVVAALSIGLRVIYHRGRAVLPGGVDDRDYEQAEHERENDAENGDGD